jgi:hypothetical protein
MSKRRKVGDVVVLDDDDETAPYLGCIDALDAERGGTCPHRLLEPGHDQTCAEWPNVQLLDQSGQPTGLCRRSERASQDGRTT